MGEEDQSVLQKGNLREKLLKSKISWKVKNRIKKIHLQINETEIWFNKSTNSRQRI